MYNIQCLCVSGGSYKYCCKYVGKIDKKTTAQCIHLLMITWSDVQNVHNTKRVTSDKVPKSEQEKNETGNICKGQLSVSMKSGTTF